MHKIDRAIRKHVRAYVDSKGTDQPVYPRRPLLSANSWLCWSLTTRQPLWVILCRFPEKGRKEMEKIVEEIKERERNESKETEEIKIISLYPNQLQK